MDRCGGRVRARGRRERGTSDWLASLAPTLVACVLCPALVASAEDRDPDSDEDTVFVEGMRREGLAAATAFDTVVELAERANEHQGIEELLDAVAGVQVRRFGGPGSRSEISIRGASSAQVVVLLDGIRLNSAQSGSVDLSTIPVELVERIEVVRGGGSVRTGSDAIGGVVNIVTKRPRGEVHASASFGGGSFGTWRGSLSLADAASVPGAAFQLAYDGFYTEGDWRFQQVRREFGGVPDPTPPATIERINNDVENHAVLLRQSLELADSLRLSLSDHLFIGERGSPGPAVGQGAFAGQSPNARSKRLRNVLDLRAELDEIGHETLSGELRVFHRYERNRFDDRAPALGTPTRSDDRNHAIGQRGELRFAPAAFPLLDQLSLGVEHREDLLDSRDFRNRGRTTVGTFVQADFSALAERVEFVSALRVDYTEGIGTEWIPSFGLGITLVPGLRALANLERAYRVPNFDELFRDGGPVRGNVALRPEDARGGDVGFEWRVKAIPGVAMLRDLSLQAAYFRREIDNAIVFQLVNNALSQATDTGKARARGVEVSLGTALGSWLDVSGNYTWTDTERRSSQSPIPGTAEHEYSLRLALSDPEQRARVAVEQHYVGDIPVNASGTTTVEARTTWDLRAWVDLAKLVDASVRALPERMRASLAVTNIADRSVRDAQFFPQPGRTLHLGLEGSW